MRTQPYILSFKVIDFGSGEEDFLRFLPCMGMAAILVMCPSLFEQLFFPKGPGGCIRNLVTIGPAGSFRGEVIRNCGQMDRRTTEPDYTINYPGGFSSGKLKLTLNYPKSELWNFFQGTQEQLW